MNGTLKELRAAARDRHDASLEVLGTTGGRPQLACYLMHVSLECILKCRILVLARKTRIRDLEAVLRPAVFEVLFFGRRGHSLRGLAEQASLRRLLEVERRSQALAGSVWSAMCADERPYSLRYGSEAVSREAARKETEIGAEIFKLVERSLR